MWNDIYPIGLIGIDTAQIQGSNVTRYAFTPQSVLYISDHVLYTNGLCEQCDRREWVGYARARNADSDSERRA